MPFLSIAMVFVIVLNVLRLINLWFEPRILRHPLFKEKPDKYHYTMYHLMLIIILGAITLNRHGIIKLVP